MNEKNLLKQLNNLKGIKPNPDWKEENKSILLNQLGAIDPVKVGTGHIAAHLPPISYLFKIPRQAMAIVVIAFFAMGSGLYGLSASKNTKPGDSLYIAKIMGEKTQLAFTFNDKSKTKLNLEFAENRVREMSLVLAAEDDDTDIKRDKVEKLVGDFKKEINSAKVRVEKISRSTGVSEMKPEAAPTEEDPSAELAGEEETVEESQIFSANLDKENKGIQISDKVPDKNASTPKTDMGGEAAAMDASESRSASSTEKLSSENNPNGILAEVKEMLRNGDYNGAISKLSEAGLAIEKVEFGQVKGERASSSEEVLKERVDEVSAGDSGAEF
jgi:hypothetical protein